MRLRKYSLALRVSEAISLVTRASCDKATHFMLPTSIRLTCQWSGADGCSLPSVLSEQELTVQWLLTITRSQLPFTFSAQICWQANPSNFSVLHYDKCKVDQTKAPQVMWRAVTVHVVDCTHHPGHHLLSHGGGVPQLGRQGGFHLSDLLLALLCHREEASPREYLRHPHVPDGRPHVWPWSSLCWGGELVPQSLIQVTHSGANKGVIQCSYMHHSQQSTTHQHQLGAITKTVAVPAVSETL